MGNWTVTGELGAGKTILSVGKIQEFLLAGKKVASNIDLNLAWLLPPLSKTTYTRVTDFPDYDELVALGKGGESPKENTFGLLALDELAMFLNARNWQKTGRDDFIIFQRHLRKRRWHTLFLSQDIDSIDKQARNSLIERVVRAGRTDRVRLPLVGSILQKFGHSGMRPQKHIGYVYYGKPTQHSKHQDKWEYKGNDLYNAYNTEQEFQPLSTSLVDIKGVKTEIVNGYFREWQTYGKHQDYDKKHYDVEIVGSFTMLSAWHIYGRYLTFAELHKNSIRFFIIMIILFLAGFLIVGNAATKEKVITTNCITPDAFILNGLQASILHDHKVLIADVRQKQAFTKTNCYNIQ